MGAVNPDFSVIVHPLGHGCLETQINDRIDKKVNKIDFVGIIYAFSHVQHTIQSGGLVHSRLLF